MWQMSLPGLLIELSATPLALNPIIRDGRHILSRVKVGSSVVFAIWNLHCLSEHHRLKFPFWNFATGFGGCWLWLFLSCIRLVVFVFSFDFFEALWFSHFFSVEGFSFLYENFFANFLMFSECCLSEIPAASGAGNPRTIILLFFAWSWEGVGSHSCLLIDTHATWGSFGTKTCWLI